MKCLGWGEVHWTQTIQSGGPGQKPKSETIHYNGEENYFKSILALYGKGIMDEVKNQCILLICISFLNFKYLNIANLVQNGKNIKCQNVHVYHIIFNFLIRKHFTCLLQWRTVETGSRKVDTSSIFLSHSLRYCLRLTMTNTGPLSTRCRPYWIRIFGLRKKSHEESSKLSVTWTLTSTLRPRYWNWSGT